jgi:hypothetical protein
MKKKHARPEKELETARCCICGGEFQRFLKVSRKRAICGAERCKKIRSLGHGRPVKFSDLRMGEPSFHQAEQQYHGGYHE